MPGSTTRTVGPAVSSIDASALESLEAARILTGGKKTVFADQPGQKITK